jgi:hypothetical protein
VLQGSDHGERTSFPLYEYRQKYNSAALGRTGRMAGVLIWDNRCVLHRAWPYDYREVRVMRHTRVAGDPATELAPTHRDDLASAYKPSSSNR